MYKFGNAKVVGVPKTIDNDIAGTHYTFGFWSSTQLASNAIDNLTTTARSHQRVTIDKLPKDTFGNPLLAQLNISQIIVKELDLRDDLKQEFQKNGVDFECRSVVLGHTMRAGTPNSFDRILGLRFGLAAMKLVIEGKFGNMVSLQGNKITTVPLSEGVKKKYITPENDKMELSDLLVKIRYLSKQK